MIGNIGYFRGVVYCSLNLVINVQLDKVTKIIYRYDILYNFKCLIIKIDKNIYVEIKFKKIVIVQIFDEGIIERIVNYK